MSFKVVRVSEQAYNLIKDRIGDGVGRSFADVLDGLLDDQLQARKIQPQIDWEFDGWRDVRVSTQATLHDEDGNPLNLWQRNCIGVQGRSTVGPDFIKTVVFDRHGKIKHRQLKEADA